MLKYYLPFFFLILFACQSNQVKSYEGEIKAFRKDYINGFLEEERSPLQLGDLTDLSFFVADSAYRVEASYTLLPGEKPFELPTSSGKTKSYRKFAKIQFEVKDTAQHLFVYESMKLKEMPEYQDYLFLPFNDPTNGYQTYGGGRYLDLDRNDFKMGLVTIDFNKCYNPWCAYSDGFNCPVPPPENELSVFIFAGERKFEGDYKFKGSHDNHH